MIRDIKFRVWHIEKGEYLPQATMIHCLDNSVILLEMGGFCAARYPSHLVTMQQYTGINDKNGTLIYEGDFIEYGIHTWEVVFKFGSFILKREHNGRFEYQDINCSADFYNRDEDDAIFPEYEVVGNVLKTLEFIK